MEKKLNNVKEIWCLKEIQFNTVLRFTLANPYWYAFFGLAYLWVVLDAGDGKCKWEGVDLYAGGFISEFTVYLYLIYRRRQYLALAEKIYA